MRCILRRSIFESTEFRVTITNTQKVLIAFINYQTLINVLCSLCNSSFSRVFNVFNVLPLTEKYVDKYAALFRTDTNNTIQAEQKVTMT